MAARAGARKVYAVDRASVLDDARETARRNRLDGRIEFIRSTFDDLVLPERADLVVHELIGSRFWDEGLLAAIARARRRHLAPGGRLLPFRIDVLVAPTSHVSDLERSLDFWEKRHQGFDLGAFGRLALEQGMGDALAPSNVALRDTGVLPGPSQDGLLGRSATRGAAARRSDGVVPPRTWPAVRRDSARSCACTSIGAVRSRPAPIARAHIGASSSCLPSSPSSPSGARACACRCPWRRRRVTGAGPSSSTRPGGRPRGSGRARTEASPPARRPGAAVPSSSPARSGRGPAAGPPAPACPARARGRPG